MIQLYDTAKYELKDRVLWGGAKTYFCTKCKHKFVVAKDTPIEKIKCIYCGEK